MATVAADAIPVLPVESPEFWADANPFLEAARARHPWLARFSQGYIIHGYDAICELYTDDVNLEPGFGPVIDFYGVRGTMWARFMDEIVIAVGGAQHKRLRDSVIHAFTPRRANREREMMQRVVTELLDEWAPKGAFDFTDFASFFPVSVMCGLLGVSTEPIPRMRDALDNHLKSLTMDPSAKPLFMAGWEVLWDFADTTVTEREASGLFDEESLLDSIIAAKNEGRLDETEARFMLLTTAVAGYDTSKNQLGVTMDLLLDRPEMYQRCAEDLQFCRAVVEESIRHTSIASPVRTAAHDFTHRDFTFRKGDMLVMASPLASRDPSVFPDPKRFDPERDNKDRHVGFGRGEHICLGQFLARVQLQEGLHLIAQRLRNPRRTAPTEWRPFLGAWGPSKLEITFDPA